MGTTGDRQSSWKSASRLSTSEVCFSFLISRARPQKTPNTRGGQITDEKGLNLEGLYRISGRKAAGQQIIQEIELDEGKFAFEDKDDVHAVASVLKQCKLK